MTPSHPSPRTAGPDAAPSAPATTSGTELSLAAKVVIDNQARVQIPITALGAFLGGLIAVVATGIVVEGLIVLVGVLAGWLIALGVALALDSLRRNRATARPARGSGTGAAPSPATATGAGAGVGGAAVPTADGSAPGIGAPTSRGLGGPSPTAFG